MNVRKRALSLFLVFVLTSSILSLPVFADSGPATVLYYDAETLKPIPDLFQFDGEVDAQFVFERPDGSSFTETAWYYVNDPQFSDYGGFYIGLAGNPPITQPGKYVLKSFPVPDGYEVSEIYGVPYYDELKGENHEDGFYINESFFSRGFGWGGSSIHILLRKTDSTPQITPANPINTASEWARESIANAVSKGFVPADIQNQYTNVITRQEFCRMAIKWVEYATGKNIDVVLAEKGLSRDINAFTDTQDPDILAAFALGVTSGTGNNQFTPNGQFNREQAATMIMNTCKVIEADINNLVASDFADLNTASSWAINGINFVRANGIMQGTGDNNFSPKSAYTREQSIITFNNIKHNQLPKQQLGAAGDAAASSPESRLFDMINQERVTLGYFPLVWDDTLALAALKGGENRATKSKEWFELVSFLGTEGIQVSKLRLGDILDYYYNLNEPENVIDEMKKNAAAYGASPPNPLALATSRIGIAKTNSGGDTWFGIVTWNNRDTYNLSLYERGDRSINILLSAGYSLEQIYDIMREYFSADVLRLINKTREENGVSALIWDDSLAEAAQNHSQDIQDNVKFSDFSIENHTGTDGSTPLQRAQRAGWTGGSVSENMHGYRTAGFHQGESSILGYAAPEAYWYISPSHQKIMLNPNHTHIGIGFAIKFDIETQNIEIITTANFGRDK